MAFVVAYAHWKAAPSFAEAMMIYSCGQTIEIFFGNHTGQHHINDHVDGRIDAIYTAPSEAQEAGRAAVWADIQRP